MPAKILRSVCEDGGEKTEFARSRHFTRAYHAFLAESETKMDVRGFWRAVQDVKTDGVPKDTETDEAATDARN